MNMIDCVVTKVTGPIWQGFGRYWVPVEYDCEAGQGNSEIMCASLEEAEKVGVGYEFLA